MTLRAVRPPERLDRRRGCLQAAYLAGHFRGHDDDGTLAVVGGERDNVTSSQMSAFSQGVDAHNLANGTSITVLG